MIAQNTGHWIKHNLAQGILIHSVPKVFNYFRRHGMMNKTVKKRLLFVRDEFDTRGSLYFDALWVLTSKNNKARDMYYFHFHEVKSGKPNYGQMKRQLRYLYPNKTNLTQANKTRTIKADALSKTLRLNLTREDMTENTMYYYIWIQKCFHADIYNYITNIGLESFYGRTIKIMDFSILDEIAKAEIQNMSEGVAL